MSNFQFYSPASLPDALAKLTDKGSAVCVVAGGTRVVPAIRSHTQTPALLLDISRLPELQGIEILDGQISVGALTTIAQIASSPMLCASAPVLCDAADTFAGPIIRRRATVGGNITRASSGADSAPAFLALDAQVVIIGPRGERRLPIDQYFLGPYQTALASDELVTHLLFTPRKNSAFMKIAHRSAMAISIATVAVALEKEKDGRISHCRIAFGAMGSTPLRAYTTEKLFVGEIPRAELFAAASQQVLTDISPRDGLRGTKKYRSSIAGTILRRTLITAYQR